MPEKKEPDLIECQIVRDVWDADGVRHRKGQTLKLPVDSVLDGIESGALKRVKADAAAK